MKVKKTLFKLLDIIYRHKNKKIAHYLDYYSNQHMYQNNRIIIVENGKERILPPNTYFKNLKICFYGNNNTVKFEYPCHIAGELYFHCSDSTIEFNQNSKIHLDCALHGNNNQIKFGYNVRTQNINILLHSDSITIGDNCMFAKNIFFYTDGHSIIDANTKELLNPSNNHIKIGNHVWLGDNVKILKNAIIPDNSIVGMDAVVTKQFDTPNVVIAGVPAKIVKTGVNWNGCPPYKYDKESVDFSF